MLNFELKHPQANHAMLGYIPSFLSPLDTRKAVEQIHTAYAHGGGWFPLKGFKLLENGNIRYPGDPEYRLLAEAKLRNETIRVYEHGWVMVLQEDGSFEVARLD